jgi:ribonucleoside-diphosphate reductase alpha chain
MIDWTKLDNIVEDGVHFLDNVIDVNNYPIPQIEQMTKDNRKIGLGLMGWADMLFMLDIPYNSEEALKLANTLMEYINLCAWKKSKAIAKDKGVFPNFNVSIFNKKDKVRNATCTTIAPTGTLSIIAGVSSGIEPLFAVAFIKNVMDNDELIEINPYFKKVAIDRGFYSEELMKKIIDKGTIQEIEEIPEDVRRVFVTAHDIAPEWHVRTQSAFQKHTDNAISKTLNFCNSATKEDVRKAYMLAYKEDCKGVTIYRDGSRDMQVLNVKEVKGKGKIEEINLIDVVEEKNTPRQRPDTVFGLTEKVKIGCGNLYITVNGDEEGICELFTNTGRAGGCPSQSEATSRVVSIALRAGIDARAIVEQLKGIRCSSTTRQKGLKVMSCPDAMGKAIEKMLTMREGGEVVAPIFETDKEAMSKSKWKESVDEVSSEENTSRCPECGAMLLHEGGCVTCKSCGYGKCG